MSVTTIVKSSNAKSTIFAFYNLYLLRTIYIVFLFSIHNCFGQGEVVFNKYDADSTKARKLNDYSWNIKFSNPALSLKNAKLALDICQKNNLYSEASRAFKAIAFAKLQLKNYLESFNFYDSAIVYGLKSKKPQYTAEAYNKKAGTMGDFGNYDVAIELYLQGLKYAQESGDVELICRVCNNIADAYQNTGRNTGNARKYFLMSIEYALKINNYLTASLASANLAKEYSLNKEYILAKNTLIKTLELVKKSDKTSYAFAATCDVLASVYVDLKDYNSALPLAKTSYRLLDSIGTKDNKLRPMLALGDIYLGLNNNNLALEIGEKMLQLSLDRHAKIFIKEAYRILGEATKRNKNYEKALYYYEKYKQFNDSVFFMDREKNLSNLDLNIALKEKEIESKLKLTETQKANQQLKSNILGLRVGVILAAIGILAISILGFYLYKTAKRKQKINEELLQKNELVETQTKEKENLIQEIHHRVKNNLTMLQSILFLQSKNYDDDALKKMFLESQTRIQSMALVHQHLYEKNREGNLKLVEFFQIFLQEITHSFADLHGKELTLNATGENIEMGIKQAIPLGLIINELLTNSLKYAFNEIRNCTISVKVKVENKQLYIAYSDNGKGLDEPLESYQSGFGFKIIRILIKQLKAKIEYEHLGNESEFIISLPFS